MPSAVAAFFDLDHTVLSASSTSLWAHYQRRKGRLSRWQMARLAWWTVRYKLAMIDMAAVVRLFVADMAGQSEAELIAQCDAWFNEMVAPRIAPRARERIAEHRAQGHTVALLTAASPYVTAPVAANLGLGDSYICTRMEVDGGRFTGRTVEPICYGPGKVHWARIYAEERGLDLSASYFYTDSYTDLAMLQAVAHPVAVNPDARLRRTAQRRGWPIERFY